MLTITNSVDVHEGPSPIPPASWTLPSGEAVIGLNERARRLGYRSAAAASGTTANMLQLSKLLGFTSPDEMALIRLTMAAWMLPTDDHSFFEILLFLRSSRTASESC